MGDSALRHAASASRRTGRSCYNIIAASTPPPEPMYDDSGRPNSHGDVLILPGVMAMHHPDRPVRAKRKHRTSDVALDSLAARAKMSPDDFMKSVNRYPTCVRDANHEVLPGHEGACDREIEDQARREVEQAELDLARHLAEEKLRFGVATSP